MTTQGAGLPTPITEPLVVLGEGIEEVKLIKSFLKFLEMPGFHVEAYQGTPKLRPFLLAFAKRSGIERVRKIGIIQDADEDPDSAHRRIVSAYQSSEFPQIISPEFLIVPGGSARGCLESLFLKMISETSVGECIDGFFKCSSRTTGQNYSNGNELAKARVHAWLSTLPRPDLRLGEAADAGFINWDSSAFLVLKEFLVAMAN